MAVPASPAVKDGVDVLRVEGVEKVERHVDQSGHESIRWWSGKLPHELRRPREIVVIVVLISAGGDRGSC